MFTFSVLYLFLQVLFKKMVAILMLLVNLTVVYSQRLEASGFPVLPYKAVLHSLFFSFFILSHLLNHYLYNYFATIFSHFPFCFSFEINIHAFFAHLTYGKIL